MTNKTTAKMPFFIVKKPYFDAIKAGTKVNEYRSPSPHNVVQMIQIIKLALDNPKGNWCEVKFANGYNADRPEMTKKVYGVSFQNADPERQKELQEFEEAYFDGDDDNVLPTFLDAEKGDSIVYHLSKSLN